METAIRQGLVPFYATDVFPYGLSRSSYFNKRESQELIMYGYTLKRLHDGTLAPENEEEMAFISELNSTDECSLYAVQLWKKFLLAVEKRGTFHGFSMSNRYHQSNTSSNDTVFGVAS